MATAVETYPWDETLRDNLKNYLGIPLGDATEDERLEFWWTPALEDCDNFTGNTFVDADGNDIEHPKSILLGLYEWIKAFRSWWNPRRNAGTTEITTGPLREKFRGGNDGTDGRSLAHDEAKPHWYPSKVDVSLMGEP